MAFHEAAENELVKNNCVQKVERPKPRKKEPKIMTREEQKQFEKMLSDKYDFTVFLFLLKTGERASEASGTNWEDIDFENKVINVVNGLVLTARYDEELEIKGDVLEDTDLKSESSVRKIPMLFGLEELLKDYREQYMQVNGMHLLEEFEAEENEKIDEYYENKVTRNEKSKRKTYKGKIKGKLKIIRKTA